MCTTATSDIAATVRQIKSLERAGCDLVRVAVPTMEAAKALKQIKPQISIPLIADIHFSPELAIASIENGADKIRINPGNISDKTALRKIIKAAKAKNIPIRIGVNEGSLEKDLSEKYGPRSAKALALSAKRWIGFFEKEKFKNLVVSVKSSDVKTTIEANRLLKKFCKYPIHLGVTESGTLETGTIKSAIGIGALLVEGIGDTIRVSLSADPIHEVRVAKKILDSLNLARLPLRIIACPTCGRTKANIAEIAQKLENELLPKQPTSIAVLGCGVNFAGESKGADYAIIGISKNKFSLYKKDKPLFKNANFQTIFKYLNDRLSCKKR